MGNVPLDRWLGAFWHIDLRSGEHVANNLRGIGAVENGQVKSSRGYMNPSLRND